MTMQFVSTASIGGGNASFLTGSDARAAERRKMSGRARVVFPGGNQRSGKMVDMSVTGACVLMEDPIPVKQSCTLELDIFQSGVRQVFNVSAVTVYGVLASGQGYKVGFHFGKPTAAASNAIAALLK
jgi:hypothetical protein